MEQKSLVIDRIEGFRPSPQQRHLWAHLRNGGLTYVQATLTLSGPLDAERLRQALGGLVERHEALQTSLRLPEGAATPLQVVAPPGSPPSESLTLNQDDWRGKSAEEQEAALIELRRRQAARPFNPATGSPLRADLLSLEDERHLLLVTVSGLAADSRSLEVLAQDLAATYAGHPPAEEAMPYLQFSEWRNELLDDPDGEEGRRFWKTQTADLGATVRLPFEASEGNSAPKSVWIPLEPSQAAKVTAAAAAVEVSLGDFLLTAWKSVLWRFAGEGEVVVATSFDGRPFEELAEGVGPFAQHLPLRGAPHHGQPFAALALETATAVEQAEEWQPFFSFPDGFSYGFELERRPQSLAAGDLELTLEERVSWLEPFAVKLRGRLAGEALQGAALDYDPARIPAEDARRLGTCWRTLLLAAAEDPQTAVGRLELLTEDERRAALGGPVPEMPAPRCVHERIVEQARLRPEADAVVLGEQRLTYAELDRRSDRLARRLRRLGAGPEVTVGICAERSPELVVGLLAVLRAGGAYLPLDPVLPEERLRQMLEAASAPLLLTWGDFLTRLGDQARQLVRIDDDGDADDGADETPRDSDPANLAYVLFTSGSTGLPKGVGVEHRQLSHYVDAVTDRLGLGPDASFATVSSFAADLGYTAVFPALCRGATLQLLSAEEATDSEAFAAALRRRPIDGLKIVPSHLAALLQGGEPAGVLPRRWLVLGGEAAEPALVARLRELLPAPCRLFNHYGPTETTVGVSTYEVPSEENGTPPLGTPLGANRLLLLDGWGHPVPTWVGGELLVGGPQVARGYLQRPRWTAERFVPDPSSQEGGARLYRTGDLGRRRADGGLEFLGRVDHQVKIRGYRVELGEIESLLRDHEEVRETVVTVHSGRLLAYVVKAAGTRPETARLRDFLERRLPAHMVPTAFVYLERLPRLPNGKPDRTSLPSPEAAGAEQRTYVEPQGAVEQVVAEMWQELLHLEQVGAEDDFFELGGHSLLATQLLSRLRSNFFVDVPMNAIFSAPTVRALARALVSYETQAGQVEKAALAVQRLQAMSGEEVESMLAQKRAAGREAAG